MEQLITKAKIRLPKTKILPGCSWVSDVLIVSVPRGIAILLFRQGPKAQIKYQTDCGFPCPLPCAEPRARHCPSLDTSCQALPSALHQQPLSQLTTPSPQIQLKDDVNVNWKLFVSLVSQAFPLFAFTHWLQDCTQIQQQILSSAGQACCGQRWCNIMLANIWAPWYFCKFINIQPKFAEGFN